MKPANTKTWDDPICWYCKKNPVDDSEYNEVMLNRLLKQKKTYLVTAMSYKMSYESTSVKVPCCMKCAKASAKLFLLIFVLWVLSSITVWGWLIFTAIVNEEDEFFLHAIVNPIAAAIMLIFPFCLLFLAANRMFIMKADDSNYPVIQTLLADGWKLGEEPDRYDEVHSS